MDTLNLSVDARGVATLSLARPEKHNALSGAMITELSEAAHDLAADNAVRVVVLTGQGASFCAGGDLGWMRDQIAADDQGKATAARELAQMLFDLNTLPKPMIGLVNGNAFGGGIGMMSVCDVVIADRAAKFGLTETRLGLLPATIGPYVAGRMGEANARRVFMSSRVFNAEEAQTLGLIKSSVETTNLDAAVEAEVAPYLSCAPDAVAEAKALLRSLGPKIDTEVIEDSIAALIKRWKSPESAEGIAAFFEKRPANWTK